MIRLLSRMSFELGGKYLADLHGFGKLASAVTILHDAKDPHKPYAFLQHVMRPVITASFWREHELELESTLTLPTVEGFIIWLGSYPLDKKFTLFADFYVLRDLSALHLFRGGVRANDALAASAARKVMIPLYFARGSLNYGPGVLEEVLSRCGRMPKEVREMVELFYSFRGQGWDWLQEVRHRRILRAVTKSNSAKAWQRAAGQQELMEVCRVGLPCSHTHVTDTSIT
jgi:hypothetical protein